jgi:hypothetical protein
MRTDEGIREALRAHAEHADMPLPPVDEVFARARRQTATTGLAWSLAIVAVAVAVVASVDALRSPVVEFFEQPAPGVELGGDDAAVTEDAGGADRVRVPDVTGMTLAEAEKALQAVDLAGEPVSGPAWSDPDAPEAVVVAQQPPVGTELAAGEVVGFRTALVTPELCDVLTQIPPRRGDAGDLARSDGYWDVLRQARPVAQSPLAGHMDDLLAHDEDGAPLGEDAERALDSVAIHHDACSGQRR